MSSITNNLTFIAQRQNSISTNKTYTNDYKKRLKTMGAGMIIGSGVALCYNRNKNIQTKQKAFKKIEAGAFCGLMSDIFRLILDIQNNVIPNKHS